MKKLILISGPCVIEDEYMPLKVAETVKRLTDDLGIEYVFKSSFKKANRSSLKSFTGIDFDRAMRIMEDVKTKLGVPVLTDVHETADVASTAAVCDYLQIPAFLCRQTDLLLAAGKSGRWVNVKKGQFSSPQSMQFALEKVRSTGNNKVMLTERGTTFGYTDLLVDFRSVPIMKGFDCPVILDATHSLQQPNQSSGVTGGLPHLIETIVRAGIAAGVDGLFIETHPDPQNAMSDGANMLALDQMPALLRRTKCLFDCIQDLDKAV